MRILPSLIRLGIIVTILGGMAVAQVSSPQKSTVDYAEEIQPILRSHCYGCHGPNRQESNYRLDVRDAAFGEGDLGGKPIVRRDATNSPLVKYIAGIDDELQMPPEGKRLSLHQVATIRKWIDQGATWPDQLAGDAADDRPTSDHWSFQAVVEREPPAADGRLAGPIDRFIVAKLKQSGLTPSPMADKVTLLRRVLLDMHGLPPTDAQLEKFAGDSAEQSYEKLVDAILASHHYGERWARHWLDVVRFAESTGYEVNRDRENAYHYRDYVIESLNADKSYRDFIIEQLAGDVVGVDVGTGFLVGGPHDIVKSPDINLTLMQRQDELADYVNTTSTTFLAMTVGCARCHNHKFDPIPQRDYYAMQAVFAGVQHGERPIQNAKGQSIAAEIKRMRTIQQSVVAKIEQLREEARNSKLPDKKLLAPVNFAHNVEKFAAVRARRVRFTIFKTSGGEPCIDEIEVFSAGEGVNVALATAGSVATASGNLPNYEIHQIKHINDGKLGNSHSWISNTPGGGWIQIEFPTVETIERIEWGRDRTGVVKDRLPTEYKIEASVADGQWTTIVDSSRRKSFSGDSRAFLNRLPPERAELARKLLDRESRLKKHINDLNGKQPKSYVGTFKSPEVIHRLYRGDPKSPREEVMPDALSVVGTLGLTNETAESQRRLKLAEWIADAKNPLTARVIVNRVWQYHFGQGLVATPSDFGINGARPTHPELLDWLAANFIKHDWSLKWLHREILLSATYRQSSRPRPEAIKKDAASQLLWRFPPRRFEAEAIRDCVLHVSGALNPKAGGPGFLLFDIDHENVHHYFPKKELGPNEFRRMIYMMKIRQEQDVVFGVFDCPDGGQTIPNRSRSTTPLQALNLLNSRFVLQQAELFAKRVESEVGEDVDKQVSRVFELAFSRVPDSDESRWAIELVEQHGLIELCRAIFNANEFLFLAEKPNRGGSPFEENRERQGASRRFVAIGTEVELPTDFNNSIEVTSS
ncbi:MAG: DUF1553 domain-containing protein [Planctomycetota bacterium]